MKRARKDRRARLAVDIGGTFTDVVVENGKTRVIVKVLTTTEAPQNGVMEGIWALLPRAGLEPSDVSLIIHGTTLATNALIERTGARTALVTTEGFRDSIEIAYENRFEQYDIYVVKPPPLVPRYLRFGAPERIAADGSVLKALDERALAALVPELERHEIESVAVGFLHCYANPGHERRAREILKEMMPGLSITLSSDICPEVREYDRFSTACANAYIQPRMARYLEGLDSDLKDAGFRCPLFMMMSGGGLTTVETAIRNPIRLVESGPAGGAILASHIAAECRTPEVLSFDMGGTTAKICLIDDYKPQSSRTFEVARQYRFLKGSGLPLLIPVIEMVEIGAGGGSVATVDELRRIQVGPQSVGSEPGPACYGRGGAQATVTDADVVMGRIDPDGFAGGTLKLDPAQAAEALIDSVGRTLGMDEREAAFGVGEIVDENMANAARVHAIERGKVLGERTLVAFGGAAPLHAARLADKVGIDRIVVPTDAGVGSAWGFLRAPVAYEVARSRYVKLTEFDSDLANEVFEEMRRAAYATVRLGAPREKLVETRSAMMRYIGQGHEIRVPLPVRKLKRKDTRVLHRVFEEHYYTHFSRVIPDGEVEILNWSLSVSTLPPEPVAARRPRALKPPKPQSYRAMLEPETGDYHRIPVYRRFDLKPGTRVQGPAVIAENETSTVVTPAFDATINSLGYIVLERRAGKRSAR